MSAPNRASLTKGKSHLPILQALALGILVDVIAPLLKRAGLART